MSEYNNLQGQRVVAYRQGSFDAFLAAFVYWVFFRNSLKQVYLAVDPFSDAFISGITETTFPDFVVSIGANVTGLRTAASIGEKGMKIGSSRTSLYVFENSPTYEPGQDLIASDALHGDGRNLGFSHLYFHDTRLSLTQLVLKTLIDQGVANHSTREYKLLFQGLQLDQAFADGNTFVPESLVQRLGSLFPLMRPSDFPQMYELLFEPTSFVERFAKKSIGDVRQEEFQELIAAAIATGVIVGEDRSKFAIFNTTHFSHPLITWETLGLSDNIPCLLYSITSKGVRGKLFMPPGFEHATATTFFPPVPGYQFCGNDTSADVLLPHTALSLFLRSAN